MCYCEAMNGFEKVGGKDSGVKLYETERGHEIRTGLYTLAVPATSPTCELYDANGARWLYAQQASCITTSEQSDVTYGLEQPVFSSENPAYIEAEVRSITESGASKTQVWRCYENFIETFISAELSGNIESVDLLGGTIVAPNAFGTYLSQRFFESVYNPQPSEMERAAQSALESTKITTSGMWQPGRRREFLLTPFSFGFHRSAVASDDVAPEGDWLMASISAPIDQQSMTEYRYDVHEDGFTLRLVYDNTPTESSFVSPSLVFHFAADPLSGLNDFTHIAMNLGHLDNTKPQPQPPAWHRGSTFVTWGEQLEQDFFARQHGTLTHPRDFATELNTLEALAVFDRHAIPIDKVVIDDKWQQFYGTNTPDTHKWPDMPTFIRTQHELGRRILLWIKLFDPEGLPPDLCIVDTHGRPIASDPTNPDYLECLREQIHTLLSPHHMNADGLKLDFLAQLPHGKGLRWHGSKRGMAALYDIHTAVYEAAKKAKNDTLIQSHVVSPWFAHIIDQIRLNDTNKRHPVTTTMGRRALLAHTLMPTHSIDPDGWPLADLASWREYIGEQPRLAGSVTTHFIRSLNAEPMSAQDYQVLKTAIDKTRSL